MVKRVSEIRKIVKDYKSVLRRSGIRVTKTILYGSYANGNPKPYSDIDLVVVSPDLKRYHPLRRQEMLAELSIDIDAPLEVLGYTPAELKNSSGTIFGQILSRGKILHD